MQRTGGFRRKTRHKMSKNIRQKGKLSITKFLSVFNSGDKVCLVAEPAYQRGMYFPRFHGKAGIVVGKKGNCYEIQIKDFTKTKKVIVHPVHLKRL